MIRLVGFLVACSALGCSSRTSSNTVGSAGGMAGTGTGGASDGGTTGVGGGSSGSSSSGGEGGGLGTGGSSPTGAIGTLGQPCSEPGKLVCADNYQKLMLICGGSGTWESNGTCSGNQFCDTRSTEPSAGTCQDPHPSCTGQEPGYRFCQGAEVYACNADTIDVASVEQCTGVCTGDACNNDVDPCPADPSVSCAMDCPNTSLNCRLSPVTGCRSFGGFLSGAEYFVRMSPAAEACMHCSGTTAVHYVAVPDSWARVTVSPPWSLFGPPLQADICAPGAQCLITAPTANPDYREIALVTADLDAGPRNVRIEILDQVTAVCP